MNIDWWTYEHEEFARIPAANLERDNTNFFPSNQFLLTSGYWAYSLTTCSDLNTPKFRYLIAAKLKRRIDQWKHSMTTQFGAWQQAPKHESKHDESSASTGLLCTAQIQWQKRANDDENNATKRQKMKTNKWHGLPKWTNEVQIKYKTTQTSAK